MTAPEANYEHHFITQDVDSDGNQVTFSIIEDESGDTFWGYGHRDAGEFIEEINRWAVHAGEIDPDMAIPNDHRVDHLYAYNHDGVHFKLVSPTDSLIPEDAFPVTRLWL
ncbi:hypothetical protein H7J86_24320 [Mycobacterium hackensackense]|uniref:hypothetical protein n=1 Tax=Mycobacterium hackensackense TaxID=228909 RepID=UPI002265AE5A|nr:hypothetical protein [Mycobacterium hackensackense]MCV7255293.1 hypothetical protein [Mycobacterium hackensackense]